MNFRERILKTFKREKIDKIVWQPRIEHWYTVNKLKNKLPQKYKNKNILEIYDDLNASVRYWYDEEGFPLKTKLKTSKIKSNVIETERKTIIVYETPIGSLQQIILTSNVDLSSHTIEYPIKSINDLKIMEYILKDTEYYFDYNIYDKINKTINNRGTVQFFYSRSPLQRLIVEYAGFEPTIFMLMDYPDKIKEFLKVIEESDDQMYEIITKCPAEIINFGENIDATLNPPSLFTEYFIPYYNKRIEQLHKVKKFCHIHMDGSLKTLLPYIKQLKFDGIEAATPIPQGDVTIEEIKESLQDKILLDGIPALLFLDSYSYDELEKMTLKILDLFSPNLILGISDEISPVGDIEKVRFVSNIVENYKI